MTTLFLSLQGLSPMHQATEAELMRRRIERGDEVHVLHCMSCLSTCNLNSTHNLLGCAICQQRAWSLSREVLPEERHHRLRREGDPPELIDMPRSLEELLDYTYQEVNIGRGAASSIISTLRDYALDLEGAHRSLLALHLRTAAQALRNYRRVLDEVKPDEVILFNGRHSELWPMLELCRVRNIDFVCHERGGSEQLFQEFRNSLPHSIATRRQIMDALWKDVPEDVRTAATHKFYQAKRGGSSTDDRSYLQLQKEGLLPHGFDEDRHNIVIFNSSEDEMQAIGEWHSPLFRQQNDVISALAERLRGRDGVHIYIRMHPNLRVVDNRQTRELYALQQNNLTLLRPEDPVSTYALLEAADVTLSFASTAGIEATYWGTASVLYGRAFYEKQDAVYEPDSFEALVQTLTTPDLPPKPRENALKYGYFMSHFGEPYRFATVCSTKKASVGGHQLRRITPLTLKFLVRFLPQLLRWWRTHRIVTGRRLRLSEIAKLHSHLREKA